MNRRGFIAVASAGIVGATAVGRSAAAMIEPEGPEPKQTDFEVVDRNLTIETMGDDDDAKGSGLAWVEVEHTGDYPLRLKLTLELTQDGQTYPYNYCHSYVERTLLPGETKRFEETWQLSEFEASLLADSVQIDGIMDMSNTNNEWF